MVTLPDTSAWVEYLRGTESEVHRALRDRVTRSGRQIVTTEVVFLELLAGARTEAVAAETRRLLRSFELVPIEGLADYEDAAAIYRACRRGGETIRARLDCLIAAVAMRIEAEVLHKDRDFEAIARHTPLRLAS